MSRLVVVVPLKPGARERAKELLRAGPSHTLQLTGEDPAVWRAAGAWQECLAEHPRLASTAFSWTRTAEQEGVSFEPSPGPGDSEGGDVYPP